MSSLAPVLIFVYKRQDTLKKCVATLKACHLAETSDLYIFSDGAKTDADASQVEDVRNFVKEIEGFKTVNCVFAEQNKGLATSIIEGVTRVLDQYDKVIVLEDDLIVSSNFLAYMNACLDFYSANKQVFSVAGYTIPVHVPGDYPWDSYFFQRASSWGWATWKDRWQDVDWSVESFKSFSQNKKEIQAFNSGGSDMYSMLKKQMSGKLDSWAIRWCYHQFRIQGLTVYPIISKIKNIGFGEDATNTNGYNRYDTELDTSERVDFRLSEEVRRTETFVKQYQDFYSLRARFVGKLKTLLGK